MNTTLTPTQQAVLTHAIDVTAGCVEVLPPHIKGGAQKKVLDGLHDRGLISCDQSGGPWLVTEAGFEALGRTRPTPVTAEPANIKEEGTPNVPVVKTRTNSKQATVVKMLQRPEGATIAQISATTHWQAHSVRGFLVGTVKKKLGLALASRKEPGCDRTYYIA